MTVIKTTEAADRKKSQCRSRKGYDKAFSTHCSVDIKEKMMIYQVGFYSLVVPDEERSNYGFMSFPVYLDIYMSLSSAQSDLCLQCGGKQMKQPGIIF